MIKIYTTVVLLAICGMSYGQISLTAAMAPPVNSMFIYYDANVPSPAFTFSKSGINNTWDFASITPAMGAEDTVFFFPPSNYPLASIFPSATHATYEGGDATVTILEIGSGSASYLGVVGDPLGTGTQIALPANPPMTNMTFPYTYGSNTITNSYLDVFTTGAAIGQPTIDSVHYRSWGNVVSDIIAAGNMILPSGTFPALLERRVNNSVDSAWVKSVALGNIWMPAPTPPTTSVDSAFYWYSDQSLQHYAHALYDETGVMHDVHYFMSQLSTGISNVDNLKAVNVFPNPTHDFLGINGFDFPANSKWSVYNSAGQELINGNYSLNNLNVQELKPGTYVLRLTTPTGEQHVVRFVKN